MGQTLPFRLILASGSQGRRWLMQQAGYPFEVKPSHIPEPTEAEKKQAAEDQKKIFQLFFTTRPGGSGIGLANTFRFVQLHNGQIEFESEVGRGTTFRIELPLAHSVDLVPGKVRDFSTPFAEDKKINAQP